MLTFTALGRMGRLGNQLFQYTFLRSQALRLGVHFHCPAWEGDQLFHLNDLAERADHSAAPRNRFVENPRRPTFDEAALRIEDSTDIAGHFQSWRYVDPRQTRNWFQFRPEAVIEGRRFLAEHRSQPVAAVHVRLGDYLDEYLDRYYIARRSFYARAMEPVAATHRILVFSDDPRKARDYLGGLWPDTVFVDGMSASDDLFAMTRCERVACSPSTFSWWAAWLGDRPGRTVVVPREGPFRPGAPFSNPDFWPATWHALPALRPLLDHRRTVQARLVAMRVLRKASRMANLRA